MIELDTGCLKSFRLRDRAGHTVEDVALFAVRLSQTLFDDADNDLIGNQMAFVHIGLGLHSGGGTFLNRRTENITGGDCRDPKLTGDDSGLCAFAGARSTQ